jgi:ATP-dependent Clp protease, protease subunit
MTNGITPASAPAPRAVTFSHAIVYSGPLLPPQTNILRNQLAFLNQPANPQQGTAHLPATGLLIVLSSTGGNTFEMRSLYGLIRSMSYSIEIHAVGTIKSAALPFMLAADRRTAAPDTTFLFHPWTWGTELHPGHSAEGLQQFPMQLEDDVEWARDIFEERSNLTQSDIDQLELFQKTRIEDTDFALQRGLVHEVVERKIPRGIMTWNIA